MAPGCKQRANHAALLWTYTFGIITHQRSGWKLNVKSQNVYNISFSQHSRNKAEACFPHYTWSVFFALVVASALDLCVRFQPQRAQLRLFCWSWKNSERISTPHVIRQNCVWWQAVNQQRGRKMNESQSPADCRTFGFLFPYERAPVAATMWASRKNMHAQHIKKDRRGAGPREYEKK